LYAWYTALDEMLGKYATCKEHTYLAIPIISKPTIIIAATSVELPLRLLLPLKRAIQWTGPRRGNESNIWTRELAPIIGRPIMNLRTNHEKNVGGDGGCAGSVLVSLVVIRAVSSIGKAS